jgi:outer membrane protein
MNKSIHTLVAAAMFGAFSLAVHAQPAIKLYVVDMAKIYDSHYKTAEKTAQLQSDEAKAQEEVDKMNKEGTSLVEEYKSLTDQTTNPVLTAEAKSKATNEAQKVFESIQNKQREIQTFVQNSRNALNQRMMTFRNLMLEEISKTASDVAKRKGATLLVDKSGPTGIGISSLIYSDPAYDITDEVMKEINKDRPPTAAVPAAPTATTTTPSAPAAAPAAGSPTITVPGVTSPKK